MSEHSIKPFESLKCFVSTSSRFLIKNWYFASFRSLAHKLMLSISDCSFVRLNNEFVFLDPEPPNINNMYGWSRISD